MATFIVFTRLGTKDRRRWRFIRRKEPGRSPGTTSRRRSLWEADLRRGHGREGIVVMSFPSRAEAEAWSDSPAYQEAKRYRDAGADSRHRRRWSVRGARSGMSAAAWARTSLRLRHRPPGQCAQPGPRTGRFCSCLADRCSPSAKCATRRAATCRRWRALGWGAKPGSPAIRQPPGSAARQPRRANSGRDQRAAASAGQGRGSPLSDPGCRDRDPGLRR